MYQLIEGLDKHGKVTQQKLNNGLLTELASYHPATGQMTSIKTSSSAGAQDKHHLTYSYDGFSNLKQQLVIANGVSNSEQYDYDGLHRLVQSSRSLNGANPSSATVQYAYDAVGNFLSKGDFATNYQYASGKPNAVSQVTKLDGSVVQYGYDNVGNMTSGDGKTLSYNAFNKPTLITKNSISSAFSYGADLSRYKQVKTTGAKTETIHYVDKLFEKVVTQETGKATTTEYVHYIGDVAILRKKVTAGQALPEHRIGFTHRDRLGSVVTITDHNGNATEHRSYDAFGKPRKGDFSTPSTATLTSASGLATGKNLIANRGFTDHEHLDEHQLIHMNGRAYDYNLGRFLSVDPFIQAPGNSQSMNPYSYIMNNPLSGTDPTGYTSQKAQDIKCSDDGSSCTGTVEVNGEKKEVIATKNKNGSITVTDANGAQKTFGTKLNSTTQATIESLESKPADSLFDPNRSEFREDKEDPRNQYGTQEYESERTMSLETGEYSLFSYGGQYSYHSARDSEGNAISREAATEWVLLREPTSDNVSNTQTESIMLQAVALHPGVKYGKFTLEMAAELNSEYSNDYVWTRVVQQEFLYMEYRKPATYFQSGVVGNRDLMETKVWSYYEGARYTGRYRWGLVEGTRRVQVRNFNKNINPNVMPKEMLGW